MPVDAVGIQGPCDRIPELNYNQWPYSLTVEHQCRFRNQEIISVEKEENLTGAAEERKAATRQFLKLV